MCCTGTPTRRPALSLSGCFTSSGTCSDVSSSETPAPVSARFPGVENSGAIDRSALSQALKDAPEGFAALEAIVHPLVAAAREDFLKTAEASGAPLAILDIPLLFETGQEDAYDVLIVVTAPEEVQAARVLARPGMTRARFDAILARQVPDAEKRARADFIIDTSRGLEGARQQVASTIAALNARAKQRTNPD